MTPATGARVMYLLLKDAMIPGGGEECEIWGVYLSYPRVHHQT